MLMKKIMVTGGAGFIGSNFIRTLLHDNPELSVVSFDKLTYAGNLDNLSGLDPLRHTFVQGDIADSDALTSALSGCDAVVNFAADTHVDRSIHGAMDFISTNVLGVHTLLEVARKLSIPRVLLVSTDEVYGSILSGSFKEDAPLSPRNPYSASKASGDLFAQAHYETFGTPIIITRGSNTYGPRQHPEKFLPLFITNAMENKHLPLYGDGLSMRDWLHVDDHCRGIACALRHGTPGEIYNIAGDNERNNLEVAKMLLKLLDKAEDLIQFVPDRPGHDRRYAIDTTKLQALGWRPEVAWENGLSETVAWYQQNEMWWQKVKSGEYASYYDKQYAQKLGARP